MLSPCFYSEGFKPEVLLLLAEIRRAFENKLTASCL